LKESKKIQRASIQQH